MTYSMTLAIPCDALLERPRDELQFSSETTLPMRFQKHGLETICVRRNRRSPDGPYKHVAA